MQMYPAYRYHPEHAPAGKGKLVKDADQEARDTPSSEGWVDTPAAWEPGYVPPTEPKGSVRTPQGKVHVPVLFPCILWNQYEERLHVADEKAFALVDHDEWRRSPADFKKSPASTAAIAPDVPAATPGDDPPKPDEKPKEPESREVIEERIKCEELWATPAKMFPALLKDMTVEQLERTSKREALNPHFQGGRTGVYDALKDALASKG